MIETYCDGCGQENRSRDLSSTPDERKLCPDCLADILCHACGEHYTKDENSSEYCPECRESECALCGCDERLTVIDGDAVCAWCLACENGYPHGICDICKGAKVEDGSCACKDEKGEDR